MMRFLQILRRYFFPIFLPLSAVTSIVIHQVYYPSTKPIILINILLLTINLLEFTPLLIDRSANKVLHLIGVGFISILAFWFNISIGGIPTPLSDLKSFIDSVCGLWVSILVIELACLYLRYISLYRKLIPEWNFTGSKDGEMPLDSSMGNESSASASRKTGSSEKKIPAYSNIIISKEAAFSKANKCLVGFAVVITILPFVNQIPLALKDWMGSVREIDRLIYGDKVDVNPAPIALLLYLLGLFAIFIAIVVGIKLVQYILIGYLTQNSQSDFFEQYGTPIVVLVVAGALIFAIRNNQASANDSLWTNAATLLCYVTDLFTYMIVIIVAIISLLVAFETIRLVLNQCTKQGTLLKSSMQLLFILIVQYAVGLLMGILRILALRDVIESLLLFFLPDLDQSVEPRVKRVFDTGLKHEVQKVTSDMHITQSKWKQQRKSPPRHRVIRRRR